MTGLVGILLFLVHWTPGCFAMLPDFVKRVDNCPDPNNISQWMERSKMRNCFHNLSSNDPKEQEHVYHCLPSSFLNETVEFCGRSVPIAGGNCPIYSYEFSSNIAPTSRNCSQFTSGCPNAFFYSKFAYKYPNCLKINRKKKCFEAVLKCGNGSKNSIITTETTPVDQSSQVKHGYLYALLIVPVAMVAAVVYFCIFKKRGKNLINLSKTIPEEELAMLMQNGCNENGTSNGHAIDVQQTDSSMDNLRQDVDMLLILKCKEKLSKAMTKKNFKHIKARLLSLENQTSEHSNELNGISYPRELVEYIGKQYLFKRDMFYLQELLLTCNAFELFSICAEYAKLIGPDEMLFFESKISPSDSSKVIYIIHCPKLTRYTVKDLENLRTMVVKITNAEPNDVLVSGVRRGSIIVTLQIRNCLIPKLYSFFSARNRDQIREMSRTLRHEVLKVLIQDQAIYICEPPMEANKCENLGLNPPKVGVFNDQMSHSMASRRVSSQVNVVHCSQCQGDTEYYCITCKRNLCLQCKRIHTIVTRQHNITLYRNKHNFLPDQDVMTAKENKQEEYEKIINNIRRNVLHTALLLAKCKRDIRTYQDKMVTYKSAMAAKAERVKEILDNAQTETHIAFLHEKWKLQKRYEMKNYINNLEQSANRPVDFLQYIKKPRFPNIQNIQEKHRRMVLLTNKINIKDLIELLSEIHIIGRGKRRIENESQMKLIWLPVLKRTCKDHTNDSEKPILGNVKLNEAVGDRTVEYTSNRELLNVDDEKPKNEKGSGDHKEVSDCLGKKCTSTDAEPVDGKVWTVADGTKKEIMGKKDGKEGQTSEDVASIRDRLPLKFHKVHGINVDLLYENTLAKRRRNSPGKSMCFSSRPIVINEKVYIQFVETSTNWCGLFYFGFTNKNPESLKGSELSLNICPDTTGEQSYLLSHLDQGYATPMNILHFYVTQNGDVMYGINGKEIGTFPRRVSTTSPLWALLDIYGKTISIQLVDKDCKPYLPSSLSYWDSIMHSHSYPRIFKSEKRSNVISSFTKDETAETIDKKTSVPKFEEIYEKETSSSSCRSDNDGSKKEEYDHLDRSRSSSDKKDTDNFCDKLESFLPFTTLKTQVKEIETKSSSSHSDYWRLEEEDSSFLAGFEQRRNLIGSLPRQDGADASDKARGKRKFNSLHITVKETYQRERRHRLFGSEDDCSKEEECQHICGPRRVLTSSSEMTDNKKECVASESWLRTLNTQDNRAKEKETKHILPNSGYGHVEVKERSFPGNIKARDPRLLPLNFSSFRSMPYSQEELLLSRSCETDGHDSSSTDPEYGSLEVDEFGSLGVDKY